jgi:hypothetical protein
VLRHPPPPDDDEEEETRTRLRCNKGGDEGCHLEYGVCEIQRRIERLGDYRK